MTARLKSMRAWRDWNGEESSDNDGANASERAVDRGLLYVGARPFYVSTWIFVRPA